ncbi:MAG TPA: amidohydrolase family protein [Novosphingobium sp.]|nr:amidohydrolase family protein [Novosphingobium sp.]
MKLPRRSFLVSSGLLATGALADPLVKKRTSAREEILLPGQPIVDAHHHLWDKRALPAIPVSESGEKPVRPDRYMLDELLADAGSGHDLIATVFVSSTSFFRKGGPDDLRSLGETEAINGIAAMSASGIYGDFRACAGIVGNIDLTLRARAGEVAQAHLDAAGSRFRGVRNIAGYDDDENVLPHAHGPGPGLYLRPDFRDGFRQLAPLGLSFDAWLLEPQLPDLIDLARAFPETTIVLDHLGTPVGSGRYRGRREERYPIWHANMTELAKCANVRVKLGGMGMAITGFASFQADPRASSEQLAREWRPYIEPTIEMFGVERCMFVSNFPGDGATASYATLWNAFKRIASGASAAERDALFAGTAAQVYRLDLPERSSAA